MSVKAILFDHDGTLVDSERAHFEMWRNVLDRYGIELSYDEYVSQYAGIPTQSNAVTIVADYELSVTPAELIEAKSEATKTYLSKHAFPLMDGALASIRYFCEQGYVVGIVTGAGREGVDATLVDHGLSQYISVVVSGDDVEKSKPAPDCYVLAAQTLGVEPSECLAFEDTYNGSLSAISAGIRCVGVSASANVRRLFSGTLYDCENLNIATRWVSENVLLTNQTDF